MPPFEDELKKALAPVDPPDGFTERLAARIAALPPAGKTPSQIWNWRWAAAAAAIVLVSGGMIQREHEHAVKGVAAKQQLMIAMRITSSKLQRAQERIQQVEREGNN